MSIELPEASIIAQQLKKEIVGKRVVAWEMEDAAKLQKSKMINSNIKEFDGLVSRTCENVISRGNMIRIKFDLGQNLLLAPEYGGEVLLHSNEASLPKKRHLQLEFGDGSYLTVRLKGWGAIYTLKDDELQTMYTYARDFSETLSPDESTFTYERFAKLLSEFTSNIKMALVGKDAVIVGIQNSAFQDIIYRAGIHPKRRASDLNNPEAKALFGSIQALLDERKSLGGKGGFVDIYGFEGKYEPAMGPNMKEKNCPKCGTGITRISHGGGHVYICPNCQH